MNSESETVTKQLRDDRSLIGRLQSLIGLHVGRLPALLGALLIAEFFFKFGSFTLECVAFLALWRVLDVCFESVRRDD